MPETDIKIKPQYRFMRWNRKQERFAECIYRTTNEAALKATPHEDIVKVKLEIIDIVNHALE